MSMFKWLARIRIVCNVVLGGLLLLAPQWLFDGLGEALPQPPDLWLLRTIGIGLLYVALAHVASALVPEVCMSSNLFVVAGPFIPVVLLVWLGLSAESRPLLMLAAYETVFALVLFRSFQTGWLADLNSKP